MQNNKPHLIDVNTVVKFVTVMVEMANEALTTFAEEGVEDHVQQQREMILEAAQRAGKDEDDPEVLEVIENLTSDPFAPMHISAMGGICSAMMEAATSGPTFVDMPDTVVTITRTTPEVAEANGMEIPDSVHKSIEDGAFIGGISIERRPRTDAEIDEMVNNAMGGVDDFLTSLVADINKSQDDES